jgi:arylsulfatase A-like enzyme
MGSSRGDWRHRRHMILRGRSMGLWASSLGLAAVAAGLLLLKAPRSESEFVRAPCEAVERTSFAGGERRSLVLLTVDTLRADRIGAYGYEKARTPVMDSLAAEGVRFENATAPIPRTTPALASLLTGLSPQHHGSREVGEPITDGISLATVLCESGYTSLAVSASPVAGPRQKLEVGFAGFLSHKAHAGELNQEVLRLLEETNSSAPIFLWVHYTDPHYKYSPPESWSDQPTAPECRAFTKRVKKAGKVALGRAFVNEGGESQRVLDECGALYDSEIAYVDAQIGSLLAGLRASRWLHDPIIVLTSDHGENLGEDGLYYEHGPSLNDASLRVPLIVSGSGFPTGLVSRSTARLVDVMPTLLSTLGIPASDWPNLDGRDLSPHLLEGRVVPGDETEPAFAESAGALHFAMFSYLRSGRESGLSCLNGSRFSLCEGERSGEEVAAALYDHLADPELSLDVSETHPEVFRRLQEASLRWPPGTARARSIRTSRFKLVEYPLLEGGYRRALFDLHEDPQELENISDQRPEVFGEMGSRLDEWTRELPQPQRVWLSTKELEALRALGYAD